MLSFFPLDFLDEIWDLIESVSEGVLTYSYIYNAMSDWTFATVYPAIYCQRPDVIKKC